jgi:hypothetical protein
VVQCLCHQHVSHHQVPALQPSRQLSLT